MPRRTVIPTDGDRRRATRTSRARAPSVASAAQKMNAVAAAHGVSRPGSTIKTSAKLLSPAAYNETPSVSMCASYWSWVHFFLSVILCLCALGILRISTDITNSTFGTATAVEYVFWFGWLTAVSTGLGVIPFLFSTESSWTQWQGTANAVAAGMMLAASGCLVYEAVHAAEGPHGREDGSLPAQLTMDMVDDPFPSASGSSGYTHVHGSAKGWAVGRLHAMPAGWRCAVGVLAGWAFVAASKRVLDAHEHLGLHTLLQGPATASSLEDSGGQAVAADKRRTDKVSTGRKVSGKGRSLQAELKRAVLVVAVMTLHSASEGVGLGVSFGADSAHVPAVTGDASVAQAGAGGASSADASVGSSGGHALPGGPGHHFGAFMSLTLAVHNVPEGLATCLVLLPSGMRPLQAALWAVFTSLPQPLLAVPSFLAVQAAAPALPIGLGFAAGAMTCVALGELLLEAVDELGHKSAGVTAVLAAGGMLALQAMLK